MKNINHLLTDAQEMHKQHPETFEAPDLNELKKVKPGTHIKICVSDEERFWVIVIRNFDNLFHGVVDNDLICSDVHGIHFNDVVEFSHKFVYSVIE